MSAFETEKNGRQTEPSKIYQISNEKKIRANKRAIRFSVWRVEKEEKKSSKKYYVQCQCYMSRARQFLGFAAIKKQ